MKDNRTVFVATFVQYEPENISLKRKSYFKDVRLGDGYLVAKDVVFEGNKTSEIIGHLSPGEIVSFQADVEFKDVDFLYPHGNPILK